ncbi:MAG: hypothetical protein ACE5I0_00695 [Candidatus Binatia bacterium]
MTGRDLNTFYMMALSYVGLMVGSFLSLCLFSTSEKRRRLAIVICVINILIFNYWAFKEAAYALKVPENQLGVILAIWLLTAILACGIAWRIGSKKIVGTFAFTAGLVLVILPGVSLTQNVLWTLSISRDSGANVMPVRSEREMSHDERNVYYFILDAYGRADNLKTILDFDNSYFLRRMEDLGFQIGVKSYSNYPNTELSLSAILEMDYVVTEEKPASVPSGQPYPVKGRFARALETLRAHGYAVILATDGGSMGFGCGAGDISKALYYTTDLTEKVHSFCVPAPRDDGLSQTQLGLMGLTPTIDLLRIFAPDVIRPGGFSTIPEIMKFLPRKSGKPYILFAHILLPHLPGRFEADCTPIKNQRLLLGVPTRSAESDRSHYLGNLQCVNRRMYQAVKRIIQKDEDAIIYITADHGTVFTFLERTEQLFLGTADNKRLYHRLTGLTEDELREMFGILSLARLPRKCEDLYYKSISPVNSFRLILSCLGLEENRMLKDRIFVTKDGGRFVEEVKSLN